HRISSLFSRKSAAKSEVGRISTSTSSRTDEICGRSRMDGNSNFVLRWEIDNPTVTLITGKADSEVLSAGGFRCTSTSTTRSLRKSTLSSSVRK
ncbi:hypothetical protein PMAYCL1PPCAC_24959, partial [Pristionchus mayeri]